MRYIEADISGDEAFILPVGDIHIGDQAFGKTGRAKLKGYLEWAREHQASTRIILLGDVFNVATRASKTSPFESSSREYAEAVDLFAPYADLIIGAIDGNHENRAVAFLGFSPLESFCRELKIPYCGWSFVTRLRVGHREGGRYRQTYFIYTHHTTGGGKSLGSALTRVEALSQIVEGCDVYLGGHNHRLVTGVKEVFTPSIQAHKCVPRKAHYVSCGAYLEWDGSYAEMGMYQPSKLGSPKIRLSGLTHRDVHVSI